MQRMSIDNFYGSDAQGTLTGELNNGAQSGGVAWGKNLPDYFTHALETEDVTGLKLTGFKGEAAHPGRDKAIVST